MNSNIIYASEKTLDNLISNFKRDFGIWDEENVVDENDYEETYDFPLVSGGTHII